MLLVYNWKPIRLQMQITSWNLTLIEIYLGDGILLKYHVVIIDSFTCLISNKFTINKLLEWKLLAGIFTRFVLVKFTKIQQ